MMTAPCVYAKELEKADYLQLISERDRLMEFIKEYEAKEIAGDRSGDAWNVCPQPDVRYQMYLEYLGVLCEHMQKKYNSDYVWADRKLSDDAKKP